MKEQRKALQACIQILYAGVAAGFITALACNEYIIAALLTVAYSLLHAMWMCLQDRSDNDGNNT